MLYGFMRLRSKMWDCMGEWVIPLRLLQLLEHLAVLINWEQINSIRV